MTNELHADASVLRRARTRRNHDPLGRHTLNFAHLYLVIPPHNHLRAQLPQVLHQVVGKRIVVIEDKNHALSPAYRSNHNKPGLKTNPVLKGGIPSRVLTRRAQNIMLAELLGGLMAATEQEKRATRRFALRLPVSVSYGDNGANESSAQTRDVSARGICFYLDAAIAAGSSIEFTLILPPEITLTESIRVRCKGKVVRVDEGSTNGKVAVAAVIDEYEFLSEA